MVMWLRSCDWDHSLVMWLRSCDWDRSPVMWLRSLSGHVTGITLVMWLGSCDQDHSLIMWLKSCDWDRSPVMWLRSYSGHVIGITLWSCDWGHGTDITPWSRDWDHSLVTWMSRLGSPAPSAGDSVHSAQGSWEEQYISGKWRPAANCVQSCVQNRSLTWI